jgi:GTP cyclohydrolase II
MVKEFGFKDVRIIKKPNPLKHLYLTARNLGVVAYSRMSSSVISQPVGYATTHRLVVQARR